ncbi:hypothetical protein ACFVZD_36295 [Streptomyces sp. NPDC058287]|uniref:hypothetical protein n=1 Tax=unclassified Streptomyces TaxID=2593676 RepID=UPI0036E84BB7
MTNMSQYVSAGALALAAGLTPDFLASCSARGAALQAATCVDQVGCVSAEG